MVPNFGFVGGVERYAWELSRALKKKGHTLRLIHQGNNGRDPDKYGSAFDSVVSAADAACVVDLDVVYVHRAADPDELILLGATPTMIAVHDHIHTCPRTHRYLPLTLQPCHRTPGIACAVYGCCVIRDRRVDARLPIRLRNPFSLRGRLASLAARGPLVACSGYVATNLIRAGADPGRVHVVHPVPPEDPQPCVPRPTEQRLLVVGQLLRGKGVDLAIRAVDKLPSDCVLEVAGEGSSRDALETMAQRIAPGRIRFLGYVPPAELHKVYDRASVVLVPARWPEPFGMTGIEAMRRARPVVGAAHGGIPEWLAHGRGGLLFSPGSLKSLVSAASRMLEDPHAGKCAHEYVMARFPYATHVNRIEELLVALARGHISG